MVFHRARIKEVIAVPVTMDNTSLTRAFELKYLGLIIDSKLKWLPHIIYIKSEISKGIGLLYKAMYT